ncbi:oxidoreductase [Ktedonosporobacter rubrisoli]|uniref:Oxidoreductase n=1 Tax=Ktedonosporobacter rubrisoli TaxID=2509675 RepID=A0A4P6JMJ0_KTERU|nr:RnfABCDGE type electron transport complex subunit D [Ktedonosporobacter rubrisoli]QBD75906.1 oxidoreductase [Ktedonosporobacter rubrisoli]
MTNFLDYVLDRITMYRLVLYVLIGLIGIAAILAYFHQFSFSPLALLLSSAFLIVMCWAANALLAAIFAVPTNVESVYITALILALIIDPVKSSTDFPLLGWAAILAMSSKYVLSLYKKHLFNPAAIAVVITAFTLRYSASWWVGTASMLPAVLIGGFLIVRKLREERIVGIFILTALVTICLVSIAQGLPLLKELQQLLVESPLFFFAAIMFTEPLTMPATQKLREIYAIIVGVLMIPQIHLGPIYSTPEIALVIGNLYAYLVSPKHKVMLKLSRKKAVASNIIDFVFKPSHRLSFKPGQYMEFTLAHVKPDSRGNRRYFTLASSPTEENLHLGVRFYPGGSSFKSALSRLNNRTTLLAGQLAGDFTLPQTPEQKLVFIAGGIGITPFRSMLKYLIDMQEPRDIVLFYANKTVDEIAYTDVLAQAQTQLGIRVFYTLTDTEAIPGNWHGLTGRINVDILRKLVPDYQERSFYLSGPPDMVRATEQVLKNMQVHPKQIKKDFFPGLV